MSDEEQENADTENPTTPKETSSRPTESYVGLLGCAVLARRRES